MRPFAQAPKHEQGARKKTNHCLHALGCHSHLAFLHGATGLPNMQHSGCCGPIPEGPQAKNVHVCGTRLIALSVLCIENMCLQVRHHKSPALQAKTSHAHQSLFVFCCFFFFCLFLPYCCCSVFFQGERLRRHAPQCHTRVPGSAAKIPQKMSPAPLESNLLRRSTYSEMEIQSLLLCLQPKLCTSCWSSSTPAAFLQVALCRDASLARSQTV